MSSAPEPDGPRPPRSTLRYGIAAAFVVVLVIGLTVIVARARPTLIDGGSGSGEVPPAASVAPGSAMAPPAPTADEANATPSTLESVQPVAPGEITSFQAERDGRAFIDALSSGVATYGRSPACDVPEYPCYIPPALDKVARMDVGAVPSVPSSNTCYITGHSNWRSPQDPHAGVFSELQQTRVGDTFVVTTTSGVFVYAVTQTIDSLPFDELRSNADIKSVRPNTCVVISCHIDGRGYSGNFVAFATLTASRPA